MKKLFFVLMLVVILPSVIAQTSTKETAFLSVNTAFTDPYPAEPGKNLELSIELTNDGTKTAENVYVKLEVTHPFTLLEKSEKYINNIMIGHSRIVEYDLFVDSSAISTTYKVPVLISYDSTENLTKEIEIRVQGKPEFKLLNMKSKTINPGNQETITVEIQNVGGGVANRLTATLSSSSDAIKPVFSGGNVYIGTVKPGEKKTINFRILASSDAEYGVYPSKLNLTYEDESKNKLSEVFDVGILVSGKPEIQIIKIESDKKSNELSIEVVNIGSAKAVGVKGELLINNNVFDVDYITQIKIDKHATFKFNLPSRKYRNGELRIFYSGPDNREYSQSEMVFWNNTYSLPRWVMLIVGGLILVILWKWKPWKIFRF